MARRLGAAQVLARSLCRFRYIPFHDLPKRDRLGYLQVQLQTWEPFPESEYALVMKEDGAVVLAWDQTAYRERCETAGLPTHSHRLIPETLLHPALQEGVELRRCAEGLEGLVWRDGVLVASRWWAQVPNQESWLNFQRGAGVLPGAQIDAPPTIAESLEWAPTLWAEPQRLSDILGQDRLQEQMVLAFTLLLLALPTLWLLKNWLLLDRQVTTLTKEQQHLEEVAQPVIQARVEALDALTSLEAIVKRVDHPTPVVLLSHLSRQLPRDGNTLRELEWKGARVRLILLPPPSKSRIAYVKALEDGGWLHNVREVAPDGEGGGEGVVLVADLVGNTPPGDDEAKAKPDLPNAKTSPDSSSGNGGAGGSTASESTPDKGAGL